MARTKEEILKEHFGKNYPWRSYEENAVLNAMEAYHKEKLREEFPIMKIVVAKCNEDTKMYSDPEELQSKLMSRKDLQEAAYANGFINCYNWLKSLMII